MTVQEIYYLFQFIAEKSGYMKDVTIDQFNLLLKNANTELENQVYGYEQSPKGYETSQKRTDSLRHLKTSSTISLTSGVGNIPDDYFHISYILYGDIAVNVVTDYEYAEMKDNAILEPSVYYPIAVIGDTTFTVYPTSISSVTFAYLKHETTPVLAFKSENGIYAYDSSTSVQLQWPEEDQIEIVRIMLTYLGISIGRNDIVQYMEQKQNMENA